MGAASLARSILDRQSLPDFIEALVESVEPRMHGAVVDLGGAQLAQVRRRRDARGGERRLLQGDRALEVGRAEAQMRAQARDELLLGGGRRMRLL